MTRTIIAALLSLSAATAAAAESTPTLAVCRSIATPFALPSDDVTTEWGDADYSEWLDDRAAIYCARHSDSVWCACYVAGAFDL